ncbi:magnesium transporter, partial [Thermodesulfobacteriota bacterium]
DWVAMLLGFVYGIFLGVVSFFLHRDPTLLGVVVGLSIFVIMAMSATLGTIIPLILKRFGFDAAIATGPFVTTAIDIVGVLMYFYTAKVILHL